MKKLKLIYVITIISICFLPILLMPFLKNNTNIEKKELSKFPLLIKTDGFNQYFSTEFEEWLKDRLPLRAYILSASNIIKGELFKAKTSNVIVGKNGWLFVAYDTPDYLYTSQLTEEQINTIGVTISLIEEDINKKGGNFTFVVTPNKSSVYDEYMPFFYRKNTESNLLLINKKLDDLNVTYVNMLEIMRENKDKGLYHKRDSHWNYQGALIGYNAIMDSLKREHKTYSDAKYKIEKNWRADLDKMLYPAGGFMDYQYYYDIEFLPFRFDRSTIKDSKAQMEIYMSDKEINDDYFRSLNNNITDSKKLYMIRDSFGRALLPFFIDNYKEAIFKRTENPDIENIKENTDLVYEIVERNVYKVIATAPFLYAPERENIDSINKTFNGNVLANQYTINDYGIKMFGALSNEADISNNRIYVEISGDNFKKTYEAFPIFEYDILLNLILEGNSDARKGYSMYINPNTELNGEYEVKIIIGDKFYEAGKINIEK